MDKIEERLDKFKFSMIKEGVRVMKEIRNTHLPQMQNDVIILTGVEFDTLLEKNDPNSQLAKLLKTMQGLFKDTRGCRPQLLFEDGMFIAKDKYYAKEVFSGKSVITALTNYIEHVHDARLPMEDAGIEHSKYKYFYPPTVKIDIEKGKSLDGSDEENDEESEPEPELQD